uniref:Hint domain-containing protein n=1 Tax=Panagrolaimus superbus TaxID=310955 RepID=A0A914Z9H0_9BILA
MNFNLCNYDFISNKCVGKGEWVAGINPLTDSTNLNITCCYNEVLQSSTFLKSYNIGKGQMVKGGEIKISKKIYGFLYISNIMKIVNKDQSVYFKVFVNQLICNKIIHVKAAKIFSKHQKLKILGDSKKIPIDEIEDDDNSEVEFAVCDTERIPIEEVSTLEPTSTTETLPFDNSFNEDAEDTEVEFGGECFSEQGDEEGDVDGEVDGDTAGQSSVGNGGSGSGAGAGAGSGAGGGGGVGAGGGAGAGGYPSGASGAGGAGSCFSGDTMVKVLNGRRKRIDELKLGEWVSSAGNGKVGFNKVVSWLHRMPTIESEFLKLTLENGKTLKLTKKHLIYKVDCLANETFSKLSYLTIPAENMQISDCVLSLNHRRKLVPTRISLIEIIREKGIYAPLTESGNIIVNEIFASCSSEIENPLLTFVLPILNKYFEKIVETFGIYYNSIFESNKNEIELIPGVGSLINFAKIVL